MRIRPLQYRVRQETDRRNAGEPTLPSTIELELATNPFFAL